MIAIVPQLSDGLSEDAQHEMDLISAETDIFKHHVIVAEGRQAAGGLKEATKALHDVLRSLYSSVDIDDHIIEEPRPILGYW